MMFNSKWFGAVKKVILLGLFFLCCATLLFTWQEVRGVQTLNGIVIITGNIFLSIMIGGLYFVSVLFYEKAKKVFFCMGLSSLCMLFAIMFSKFESWGRFSNRCFGPYIGLLSVIITIAIYVYLNVKSETSLPEEKSFGL